MKGLKISTVSLMVAAAAAVHAQTDSLNVLLDEVVLEEHRNISALQGSLASGIRIDTKMITAYPKLFGYTDPMRYVQSLPGVSTNSENRGGLHVQGSETSHSQILLSDVPVYGPAHLLGFFSMFNQDHFPNVTFSLSDKTGYLGGRLALDPADTIPARTGGTATVGLISGQGTLTMPFSDRTALTLSVRRSFINTFYRGLLTMEGNPVEFGFTDANATFLFKPDDNNTLDINLFYGLDKGKCDYGDYGISMDADWGNTLASARWRHHGRSVSMSTSVFMSSSHVNASLQQEAAHGTMPSHIRHYGAKLQLVFPHALQTDISVSYYDIVPQTPAVSSNFSSQAEHEQAVSGTARIQRLFQLGDIGITPSLTFSGYGELSSGKKYFNPDPALELSYDMYNRGTLVLEGGIRHQYLNQTGMTDCGLPVEFWFAAGPHNDPQEARYVSLSYDLLLDGGRYALSLQTYGKRLENQVEYTGFLFDILTHPYDLDNNITVCSGYNYGASVMLSRQSGRLTGWLGYTFGRSLRQGDGVRFPSLFPSSHERMHEFNAVGNWKSGRWDFGASFVLAQGLPYTPANCMYLVSNCVIVNYGQYNSIRLNPYMRLDLSATCNFNNRGRLEHGINLSVYNATNHYNEVMQYLKYDKDAGTYCYSKAHFIVPVIPSVSYFCRF